MRSSRRKRYTAPSKLHGFLSAGQMPDVYHDPNGRVFLMTKGKEKVSVAQDQFGNVFMFDRNGNLYYDTGDKNFGMLVVRLAAILRPCPCCDAALHAAATVVA